jgi:hypothetical protein
MKFLAASRPESSNIYKKNSYNGQHIKVISDGDFFAQSPSSGGKNNYQFHDELSSI